MEKLYGHYNQGYTQAIKDIQEIFGYVQGDLDYHGKKCTYKIATELLNCIMMNREKVREKRSGFIRYNKQKETFEWFERN